MWPIFKQLLNGDVTCLGDTAYSAQTRNLRPRIASADKVVRSVCPYCAVGCGQLVHVKNKSIINIEGDPDSPISRGRLCPKGAATYQLVTGAHRVHHVLYRKPFATGWEVIPLDRAMDMVAERVKTVREASWEE